MLREAIQDPLSGADIIFLFGKLVERLYKTLFPVQTKSFFSEMHFGSLVKLQHELDAADIFGHVEELQTLVLSLTGQTQGKPSSASLLLHIWLYENMRFHLTHYCEIYHYVLVYVLPSL